MSEQIEQSSSLSPLVNVHVHNTNTNTSASGAAVHHVASSPFKRGGVLAALIMATSAIIVALIQYWPSASPGNKADVLHAESRSGTQQPPLNNVDPQSTNAIPQTSLGPASPALGFPTTHSTTAAYPNGDLDNQATTSNAVRGMAIPGQAPLELLKLHTVEGFGDPSPDAFFARHVFKLTFGKSNIEEVSITFKTLNFKTVKVKNTTILSAPMLSDDHICWLDDDRPGQIFQVGKFRLDSGSGVNVKFGTHKRMPTRNNGAIYVNGYFQVEHLGGVLVTPPIQVILPCNFSINAPAT